MIIIMKSQIKQVKVRCPTWPKDEVEILTSQVSSITIAAWK